MKVNQRFQIEIQPPPSNPKSPPLEIDGTIDKLTDITATVCLPVDPDQTGPKDTVRINPGEMIGVAMKFSPFCGKYMYHCHILEHEDHDMMRPFVIVPKWIPGHDQ
jgi:FtsP/CotA-like multicopper oxidase with cupredoxin domain